MWTSTMGEGSVSCGQEEGDQKPDILVDIINGWPLFNIYILPANITYYLINELYTYTTSYYTADYIAECTGVNLFRSLGVVDPVSEMFNFIRKVSDFPQKCPICQAKISEDLFFNQLKKKFHLSQKLPCTPTFLPNLSTKESLSNILSVQNTI